MTESNTTHTIHINNNIQDTNKNTHGKEIEDLLRPIEQDEPLYQWRERCVRAIQLMNAPKRNLILKVLNEWLETINTTNEIKNLLLFRNVFYKSLPSQTHTRNILIKYFNDINETFKLNLIYNEELFNKHNMLYVLDLMLKQINMRISQKKIFFENKKIKRKYSIVIMN